MKPILVRLLVLCLLATLGSTLFTACKDGGTETPNTVSCKLIAIIFNDSTNTDSVNLVYDNLNRLNLLGTSDGIIRITNTADSVKFSQGTESSEVMYLTNGKWTSSKSTDSYTSNGDTSVMVVQTSTPIYSGTKIARLNIIAAKSKYVNNEFKYTKQDTATIYFTYNNSGELTGIRSLYSEGEIELTCAYNTSATAKANSYIPTILQDLVSPDYDFAFPFLPFIAGNGKLFDHIPSSITEVGYPGNQVLFNTISQNKNNLPTRLKITGNGNFEISTDDLSFNYACK